MLPGRSGPLALRVVLGLVLAGLAVATTSSLPAGSPSPRVAGPSPGGSAPRVAAGAVSAFRNGFVEAWDSAGARSFRGVENGYTVALDSAGDASFEPAAPPAAGSPRPRDGSDLPAVRMQLVGGAARPGVVAEGALPGRVNLYLGSDAGSWRSGAVRYGGVRYRDVYPGIDLRDRSAGGAFEYDFIVASGADPSRIGIRWAGVTALRLAPGGVLTVRSGWGSMSERAPGIYQEGASGRSTVEGGYVLRGDGSVGFALGSYDRRLPLVIDPAVAYSTYYGGSETDEAVAVAMAGDGGVVITGNTTSPDLPAPNATELFGGVEDVFVAKFDATGQLEFATYLGGDGANFATSMAVDHSGHVVVTGGARSRNFPVMRAFDPRWQAGFCPKDPGGRCPETFVASLDASGQLLYSSYFGGPGVTRGTAVAVDAAGHAYVVGYGLTQQRLPLTPGAVDATWTGPSGVDRFLAEFDPAASAGRSLLVATYLPVEGPMVPGGVAVDRDGSVYVGGDPLGQGAFVLGLSPGASHLVFATTVSRLSGDAGSGIAVDGAGHVYLAGTAAGDRNPSVALPSRTTAVSPPPGKHSSSVLLAEVATTGGQPGAVVSSLLFGGGGADAGRAVAVDTSAHVWLAGDTSSSDFPTMDPVQSRMVGSAAAFVTEIDPTSPRPVLFSSYLSGFAQDHATGVAVDGAGTIAVTGSTTSPYFPTRAAAQAEPKGHSDAYLTRLTSGAPQAPAIASLNTDRGYTDRPTTLVITGSNFIGATAVTFGDTAASVWRVESDSVLRVSTPAHAAGAVTVSVVGPGGPSASVDATRFQFVGPPPNASPAPPPCEYLPGPGLADPSSAPGVSAPRMCPDIPLVAAVEVPSGGLNAPPVAVWVAAAVLLVLVLAGGTAYSVWR